MPDSNPSFVVSEMLDGISIHRISVRGIGSRMREGATIFHVRRESNFNLSEMSVDRCRVGCTSIAWVLVMEGI